jgi:hypothetical protein
MATSVLGPLLRSAGALGVYLLMAQLPSSGVYVCRSLADGVRLNRPSVLALHQRRQLGYVGRDKLRFVVGQDFELVERKRRRGYTSPDYLAF